MNLVFLTGMVAGGLGLALAYMVYDLATDYVERVAQRKANESINGFRSELKEEGVL